MGKESFDEAELGKNPFITPEFKVMVTRLTDEKSFKLKDGVIVWNEIEMERALITKLYIEPAKRRIVAKLSPAAQRLYLWLAYELESGKDYVQLRRQRFMAENSIRSVNTFKGALGDLIGEAIICNSRLKGVVWINPAFFFNGSRINKYPGSVVEYKPPVKTHIETLNEKSE